jgi:hypothetical protein
MKPRFALAGVLLCLTTFANPEARGGFLSGGLQVVELGSSLLDQNGDTIGSLSHSPGTYHAQVYGVLGATPVAPFSGSLTSTASSYFAPRVFAVEGNLQETLSGGITYDNPGNPGPAQAQLDVYGFARIVDSAPNGRDYYFITGPGSVEGHVAPGDSITWSYVVTAGNPLDPYFTYSRSGTVSASGDFSQSWTIPYTMIGYITGADWRHMPYGGTEEDYDDGLLHVTFYADISKGSGDGQNFISFDPGVSMSASPNPTPTPEPSAFAIMGFGTLVVTVAACRAKYRGFDRGLARS